MTFQEASDKMLQFFKDSQVVKTSSVWEKFEDGKGYKWVLVLHNLNWADAIIIHTKFILKTDLEKKNLLQLQFSYLYDMNCKYRHVDFADLNDLELKLTEIITENKFGDNVKNLSQFLINPTMKLNDFLYKKEIENCTIFNFEYDPHYSILPCKLINFDFKFDVNNVNKISLNLKKEENSKFVYRFQLDEQFTEIDTDDLSNIEGVIVQYLKAKVLKA